MTFFQSARAAFCGKFNVWSARYCLNERNQSFPEKQNQRQMVFFSNPSKHMQALHVYRYFYRCSITSWTVTKAQPYPTTFIFPLRNKADILSRLFSTTIFTQCRFAPFLFQGEKGQNRLSAPPLPLRLEEETIGHNKHSTLPAQPRRK